VKSDIRRYIGRLFEGHPLFFNVIGTNVGVGFP
jgi:hypothetical protein